jgi:mono/diheme cytochrome c family protein
MKAVLKAFALLVALILVLGVLTFIWIGSRGISAKAQPGKVETFVARTMRRLAIPRSASDLKNPVTKTPDVLAEGMAHYSDHCAACHANDGSGETEVGLGLYPKPPDMRLDATQSMTDGELFYIIENGVRLTGMPGWGNGSEESKRATWHLVTFIRHLPQLTPEEKLEMERLNPKSVEEWRELQEDEEFLRGKQPARQRPQQPHRH